MCGFVGYSLPLGTDLPDVLKWSRSIAHRGPDQAGKWTTNTTNRQVGIGTRRLSIQDLSEAGGQPMQSDEWVVAFNGEIYNHLELRKLLVIKGMIFRSSSDTETILAALSIWGIEDTLSRLNGVYALAIWHKVTKQLVLARDPMGVKPLYYTVDTRRHMYFGSEIRALRPFVQGSINPEALLFYRMFGYAPAPWSLLKGVRKVRPGELIEISSSGELSDDRYVQSIFRRNVPSIEPIYENRVIQTRTAVEAAIQRQLISDVPVGMLLSGGVDSSIIASVMAERKPTAFTIRYGGLADGDSGNEDSRIAKHYASHLDIDYCEVTLSPEVLTTCWEEMVSVMDEPVMEANFVSQVLLARAAHDRGVKVVLTGDGADEVFQGYSSYKAILKGMRYDRIPMLGHMFAMASLFAKGKPEVSENFKGAASVWRKSPEDRFWIAASVVHTLREVTTMTAISKSSALKILQQYSHSLLERVLRYGGSRSWSYLEIVSQLELGSQVAEHYNMRLDKATMGQSVEARVPFEDLELVNFALALSQEDKIRMTGQGVTKAILRDAFRKNLPFEAINRPKQTFQAPILQWLRGPMVSWVKNQFEEVGQTAPPVATTAHEALQVWADLVLRAWCQQMNIEPPESVPLLTEGV